MRNRPIVAEDFTSFYVWPNIDHPDGRLPNWTFRSPEFAELELATLFPRNWLPLPPDPSGWPYNVILDKRGKRALTWLLDEPYILVRDFKDNLNCFSASCTHDSALISVQDKGRRPLICPNHMRSWDLRGRCLGQPGVSKDELCAADNLINLPLAQYAPLYFIHPGADPPLVSFDKLWEPIGDSISLLPSPIAEWTHMWRDDQFSPESIGNWKQNAKNFLDKLHVNSMHEGPNSLADAIYLESYQMEVVNTFTSLQWAYARDPRNGFDPKHLPEKFRHPDGLRVFAFYWYIFPSTCLLFFPWGLRVYTYEPNIKDPTRTRVRRQNYVFDEEKYFQRNNEGRWQNERVAREDVNEALVIMSRGAKANAPRRRFIKSEPLVHWFEWLVSQFCHAERTIDWDFARSTE